MCSAHIQLLLGLALCTDEGRFVFSKTVDLSQELVNLAVGLSDLILRHTRLVLQVHLVFLVLVFVFLKRLFVGIEALFLHDNILFEQLGLFGLVVDRYLRHQYVARVQNEVSH